MAGAAPAGGGALAPPAALAAPAVAHGFTRCNIPGADNTLDYVHASNGAKLVSAFPNLGWIDAPSAAPGVKAAPALAIQAVTCCAASGDWGGALLFDVRNQATQATSRRQRDVSSEVVRELKNRDPVRFGGEMT